MITGTFQLTENTNQIQTRECAFGMLADIICQNSSGICINFIQQVIFGEYRGCQFLTFFLKSSFGKFKHSRNLIYHLLQAQFLHQSACQNRFLAIQRKAGYAFGEIAQTLQVRIDFEHGKHKTQVDSNRIIESDDVFYITVYLEFEGIDTTLAHQYLLCQLAIQSQYGFSGTAELVIH